MYYIIPFIDLERVRYFLNNDKVFILQQLSWICELCNADGDHLKHDCCTCFAKIDFYLDKITQCKQCFKLLHKSCATSNVCLDCLPISIIRDDILLSDIQSLIILLFIDGGSSGNTSNAIQSN